ncbi:MAG: GrpB family protein [Pseudonocardiales bacterium]
MESIFDTHLAVTDAGFVAPEEFQRGAVIDECNTVFNLGRAALVLLDEGDLDGRFRGTGAASDVLDRATHPPTPRREVCDRRRVRLSMARGAPRMSTEPVLVVPYDPQWASIFEELEARLRSSLEDVARRIDHIGSTAVSLSVQPVEYSPWWRLG